MVDTVDELKAHTTEEIQRYEKILKHVKDIKDNIMTDEKIVLGGGGDNMGLGGGLVGGLVLGSLLRNGGLGGLGGGGNVEGAVTPSMLTSALAGVTDTQQNTTVLQTLGTIQASVPLAEAQVQLALAGAQSDINRTVTSGQAAIIGGLGDVNKSISDSVAALLASQNNINMNVQTTSAATREAIATYGVANLNATKDSQNAIQMSISGSTKEILAALNEQNVANLQRQLTVAETALLERNAVLRSRETEINITNTNTATAQQIQAQTQQQQQFQVLAQLAANMNNLANDIQAVRQTQSNINFGVQGNAGQSQAATNNRVN